VPRGQLRAKRKEFQMLFQNPASTLHPRMTVQQVLAESLKLHRGLKGVELHHSIEELLAHVKLEGRGEAYPQELSGGQQRRVGVARMLAAKPSFVVADEPTSGLDALLRADIIDLLLAVRDEGVAYLIITHDLNVIQRACSRVAVMYRGRILEELRVSDMRNPPFHPYTDELFRAAARMRGDKSIAASSMEELSQEAPPVDGCVFLPRCSVARANPQLASGLCTHAIPRLKAVGNDRLIACHHFDSTREAV
jgi:oligopeptide/dipeptide ABC transporter ATP-binding protein